MTVFITADGEGRVTVEELNCSELDTWPPFLDETEEVEDGEA